MGWTSWPGFPSQDGRHYRGRRPLINSFSALIFDRTVAGLPAPSGSSDDAAEIAAGEVRILIREHVGLDVPKVVSGLLDAVVEGLDDVSLKCSVRGCACTTASRSASLYSHILARAHPFRRSRH